MTGISDTPIYPILEEVVAGRRLTDEETLRLLESGDLNAIMRAAHAVRRRLHPDAAATFCIDRNINYTNVCVGDCRFCAFKRAPGDDEGYVIGFDELNDKIAELYAAGGRQILMQGGLNPELPFSFYEDLLAGLRREWPDLHIHAFSPPEIGFMRDHYRMPVEEVIAKLCAAGLNSIPGGGAEILCDRVRAKVSPSKVTADDWLGIMRAAHRLGVRTTATMMFGLIETLAERVEHLSRLRALQDETGGFTSFTCWTFQPSNTDHKDRFAGAHEFLKTQAIARLHLDNFANLQTSWVTQGPHIAQMSLLGGANDLGGLMLEENVVSAAGTHFDCSRAQIERWANELGLELRQRDYYYEPFTPAQPVT